MSSPPVIILSIPKTVLESGQMTDGGSAILVRRLTTKDLPTPACCGI
jgi:hypothetical protein